MVLHPQIDAPASKQHIAFCPQTTGLILGPYLTSRRVERGSPLTCQERRVGYGEYLECLPPALRPNVRPLPGET